MRWRWRWPPPAWPRTSREADDKPAKVKRVVPQVRTTQHSGVFGGQKIRYSATIGETILSDGRHAEGRHRHHRLTSRNRAIRRGR